MNNNIVVHHSSESEEENDENQPTPKRRRGDYQEVANVQTPNRTGFAGMAKDRGHVDEVF